MFRPSLHSQSTLTIFNSDIFVRISSTDRYRIPGRIYSSKQQSAASANRKVLTASMAGSSALLDLPAELHIQILEYALIEKDQTIITSNLVQPPLLHVCSKIRKEALRIWYLSNTFLAEIQDCNAALLTQFSKHVSKLQIGVVLIDLSLTGHGNWTNLVNWCKSIQQGRTLWVEQRDDLGATWALVATAHALTVQLRKHGWEECEQALKHLRFAFSRSQTWQLEMWQS